MIRKMLNRQKVRNKLFIQLDFDNNNDEFWVMLYWYGVVTMFAFLGTIYSILLLVR